MGEKKRFKTQRMSDVTNRRGVWVAIGLYVVVGVLLLLGYYIALEYLR